MTHLGKRGIFRLMKPTILAVYGRAAEGKSSTIKLLCRKLLEKFPEAVPSIIPIDYSADIYLVIRIGTIKIGIESQGDPGSRMITENTVEKLARLDQCNIIICATRTEGATVKEVDRIAEKYGYQAIWMSTTWSPGYDPSRLNGHAAFAMLSLINSLLEGKFE